jgi:hypothetical protein
MSAGAAHDARATDTAPSCFGFRVCSSERFRFLRRGGGEDALNVRRTTESLEAVDDAPVFTWTLRDTNATVSARLYRRDGTFRFWASDAGWYRIDPVARTIDMPDHPDEIRTEQRLWGIPAMICAKHRGDFVLHAAAVEIEGGAVLLAAPGRFGKTTLALALHGRGYRLLTEDTACCTSSAVPELYPGPTSVRLRPDMFDGVAPAGTTVTAVRQDRIHLALDSQRAGDGQPLPVKAVIFLRESAAGILLEPVKAAQALPDLWTLCLRFRGVDEHRRSFSELSHFASVVPAWNLHRPLRADMLDDVAGRLVDTVKGLVDARATNAD